jgi:hypothetical protein
VEDPLEVLLAADDVDGAVLRLHARGYVDLPRDDVLQRAAVVEEVVRVVRIDACNARAFRFAAAF